MLHIIFLILKVIGILILAVLGLLLLILCLVAFVPIRYRADAGKDAQIYAKAHIHWLLHLVSVRISYGKNGVRIGFCIFGRDLLNRQESGGAFFDDSPSDKDEAPRKSAEEQEELNTDDRLGEPAIEEAQTDPLTDTEISEPQTEDRFAEPLPEDRSAEPLPEDRSAEPQTEDKITEPLPEDKITEPQEILQIESESKAEEKAPQPEAEIRPAETATAEPKPKIPLKQRLSAVTGKVKAVKRKIIASVKSIGRSLSNIRNTAHKLKRRLDRFLDFWNANATQSSIRHVLKEAKYILRHIRPRKFEGDVRFGFENPAATGKILGYLSVLSGFTGNRFTAEADFEQTCFEGEAYLTGHIRLCHIIKAGIVLLLDKNIWKTLKAFKKLTR